MKLMNHGAKRARVAVPSVPVNHTAQPSAGRPQLLLVKTELQSWLGKKYCDEADLLGLLLAHSIIRRVRTIEVEVRPLGGDSFKAALDADGEEIMQRNAVTVLLLIFLLAQSRIF